MSLPWYPFLSHSNHRHRWQVPCIMLKRMLQQWDGFQSCPLVGLSLLLQKQSWKHHKERIAIPLLPHQVPVKHHHLFVRNWFWFSQPPHLFPEIWLPWQTRKISEPCYHCSLQVKFFPRIFQDDFLPIPKTSFATEWKFHFSMTVIKRWINKIWKRRLIIAFIQMKLYI